MSLMCSPPGSREPAHECREEASTDVPLRGQWESTVPTAMIPYLVGHHVLPKESMHAIKTEFNNRVLALRDFRQQ
eukprot:5642919-Amphidinium_carterae.1